MSRPIQFWNRYTGRIETEKVYGDQFVRFLYQNPVGQFLSSRIFSGRQFSQIYGLTQNWGLSRRKIPRFVETFQIPMDQYEDLSFANFNEFFIRKFKPGLRPFDPSPKSLCAFAEGRYLGWSSVNKSIQIPVKGKFLDAADILGNHSGYSKFKEGPLLIARLCPVDYHRFHFPTDGEMTNHFAIHGEYHSVNPLALISNPDVFLRNERQVSFLKTPSHGQLAYVEVGAMCVGRIVQTFTGKEFKKGDEKGYFLFGGSTVILFGEKGAWSPSEDILNNSVKGVETFVKLGDVVAT